MPDPLQIILCAPARNAYGKDWLRVIWIGPPAIVEDLAQDTCEGRLIVHADPHDLDVPVIVGQPLPRGIEAPRTWHEGTGIHPNRTPARKDAA